MLTFDSYHVPQAIAKKMAASDPTGDWRARPYPDRHGVAPAGWDWGVWSHKAFHWVFIQDVYSEGE